MDVDAIISTIVGADEVGIQLRAGPAAGFRKPELSFRVDPFSGSCQGFVPELTYLLNLTGRDYTWLWHGRPWVLD